MIRDKMCVGCFTDKPLEEFHYTATKGMTIEESEKCCVCLAKKKKRFDEYDLAKSLYLCRLNELAERGIVRGRDLKSNDQARKDKIFDYSPEQTKSYFTRRGIADPTDEQKNAILYYLLTEDVETELWQAWLGT